MKTLSLFFIAAFILFAVSPGCSPNVGTWKNNDIRESQRNDMHEMTDKVITMIKAGNSKGMEEIEARELLNNSSFNALSNNIGFRMIRDSFSRFSEFYTVNKYLNTDTIRSRSNGDAYRLTYPAFAQEMYIAMFTPVRKDMANKEMVTITFSKYDYGWRLSSLSIGKYTFNNKTALQLSKAAKSSLDKGYVVGALHNATLAVTCLNPSDIWQYEDDGKIRELYRQIGNEANKRYTYPLTVTQVSTKPRIIGFYNKLTNEGSYPIISYLSHIPLKDTAGINYENKLMHKALDVIMPGLNKNNKYIYYLAYNRSPNSSENVPRTELTGKNW